MWLPCSRSRSFALTKADLETFSLSQVTYVGEETGPGKLRNFSAYLGAIVPDGVFGVPTGVGPSGAEAVLAKL